VRAHLNDEVLLVTTTAPPPATTDLGLGTAYERVAIYRLFGRWIRDVPIVRAAEGPIDGMAGIPGLHLLGLAHQGVEVTVCLPDDEALARVRRLYANQGVADRLTTQKLAAEEIPAGSWDVLVSYNALPYVEDWRGYLARLLRADAHRFFVVVSNPVSYGTYLRRVQRALRREDATELFDAECTRPSAIEPELARHGRIVAHDYLDCPWWPDFLLPARQNLAGDLVRRARAIAGRRSNGDGEPARFVFDVERYPYFEGQPGFADNMRAIQLHPVFDRAPVPVARFFGHLHGYVVEKRAG
jgi:hypothetical protein